MIDSEMAAKQAFDVVFPQVVTNGCLFNLGSGGSRNFCLGRPAVGQFIFG
jgi:hypothetical protein